MKKFLIECLIATIILSIGLMISRTFICGLICGIIHWSLTDLIETYFKEREEKEDV